MRCVPENAECAEVLIGSIRILTRPIMAFVRLSQGQIIGKKISIDRNLFLIFVSYR